MKSSQAPVTLAALVAISALSSPAALAQQATIPLAPIGTITASPTVVQAGTKPILKWNIKYPAVVKDFITVTAPGTVTPKQNLICDIRVLGAGVTTQNPNGSINYIRTAGKIRYNGSSSWTTLFDGHQTDPIVQQQGIIATLNVAANRTLDFGGQYYWNNAWSTFRSSTSGVFVKSLVNGDPCPARVPGYHAPSLATFLKPYLDASNKVRIGAMDVIIFMELTHANLAEVGYDEQDLALLITFRTS